MLLMMACLMTMAPLTKAYSQSAPEPAVVVSIANFEEQMGDVHYILKAAGYGQLKFMADTFMNNYTNGIDRAKNAGVLLYFNDESEIPDFMGFVPVEDLDELLDTIANAAEVEEDDDFTTIITDDGTEILLKEANGYAFISNKKESLASLPDAPGELLGEMPSKYNLAAEVYAQRIPEALRDQMLDAIRESSEMTLENMDEGLQTELQRKNLEMQMTQMEMMIGETDKLMLGMAIDGDTKSMFMDVEFTGLADSKLSKMLADSKADQPSRFTGFLLPGATFTANQCAKLSGEEADRYSEMLDDLKKSAMEEMEVDGEMSDEDMEQIQKAVDPIVDVIKATMKEGLIDSGAVLMLENGEINFAAGLQVANPNRFEEAVKELAKLIEEKAPGEVEVNLNSGSHKNVTFHQLTVEVPDDEEEMRDALGDQIELVFGIGKKEVYFAGGSNPVELLKKAMDGTQMAKEMVQYNLYITPILKFASEMEGDPMMESMADTLEKAGNDRLSMTTDLIKNGMKMRFEMQDGILGLIKVGIEGFQGGGGGFDNDF